MRELGRADFDARLRYGFRLLGRNAKTRRPRVRKLITTCSLKDIWASKPPKPARIRREKPAWSLPPSPQRQTYTCGACHVSWAIPMDQEPAFVTAETKGCFGYCRQAHDAWAARRRVKLMQARLEQEMKARVAKARENFINAVTRHE